MRRCVFCAIVTGDEPAAVVHEDDHVIAFLDLHPWRPGHTLVVPRDHATHLRELAPALQAHLWSVGITLSDVLRPALGATAVHFLLNDGRAAFQSVPHVHLHLIPRKRGDGLGLLGRLLTWPIHPLIPARRAQLEALGERIRARAGGPG